MANKRIVTAVLAGQLNALLVRQVLVAQLGQRAPLLGQMVRQLIRFRLQALDLLGRLDKLHIVIVHMALQFGRGAIAELLDAGATLLELGSADKLVDEVLDVYTEQMG